MIFTIIRLQRVEINTQSLLRKRQMLRGRAKEKTELVYRPNSPYCSAREERVEGAA